MDMCLYWNIYVRLYPENIYVIAATAPEQECELEIFKHILALTFPERPPRIRIPGFECIVVVDEMVEPESAENNIGRESAGNVAVNIVVLQRCPVMNHGIQEKTVLHDDYRWQTRNNLHVGFLKWNTLPLSHVAGIWNKLLYFGWGEVGKQSPLHKAAVTWHFTCEFQWNYTQNLQKKKQLYQVICTYSLSAATACDIFRVGTALARLIWGRLVKLQVERA